MTEECGGAWARPGHVYLGLDLGTSSLKALAVSSAGHVLGVESAGYPLLQPRPGWAEQNPDDWWAAACAALRRLTARPEIADCEVAAVGLAGQMHGATLLDADRRALRSALIWADSRGIPASSELFEHLSATQILRITGSLPHSSSTLAKLVWVREQQPELWARVAHILLAKDDLRLRLTGECATDASDASGTLLYDIQARRWSPAILDALGLKPNVLPPVLQATDIGGRITASAVPPTGLRVGTPVAIGGGDAACAAFGVRLGELVTDGWEAASGDVLVSLGTAGQVFALLENPAIDATGRVHTLCYVTPERWHLMGAILSAGYTLAWLTEITGEADVSRLLGAAAQAPAGADGLLCVPSLLGERGDPPDRPSRAAFVGLTAAHSRGQLARAALEGVALALRAQLDAFRALGVSATRVLLTGRPAADGLWQRVLADVLALPIAVADVPYSSALGAARLAARAVGEDLPMTPVGTAADFTLPHEPSVAVYDRAYSAYCALADALRPGHTLASTSLSRDTRPRGIGP